MILKQVGGSWSDPQAGGVGHGVTLKQVGGGGGGGGDMV